MLASLPSYLNRPDFIAAMEGGASAGLRARQADIEESQAADRLKLAYDQLAYNERQENLRALARQKQGEAAQALRAALAHQSMDLRAQALSQQSDLRSRALDMQQQEASTAALRERDRSAAANRRINPDGTVTLFDPDSQTTRIIGTPKPKEEKPEGKGTLHLDAQGNVTGASGPPGSEAVKGVLEQAQHRKLVASLPKPHFLGGKKLSKDQAKAFLDAAGGDKDKATQLATEAGWTE